MTKARDLSNIISGGFTADDIPSLDTAKITSGTFAAARIDNTSLSNVTALPFSAGTDWQSTIVTGSTLTAVAGKGYWIDTTSNACTITLPASASVGDQIIFVDYARTWGTNKITLNTNGLNFQGNQTTLGGAYPEYNTDGQSVPIVYSGATQGWIPTVDDDVTFETAQIYAGEYLVVAGGAGGGAGNAGGGGAGGFLTNYGVSTISLEPGVVYTVTVGAGGASKSPPVGNGNAGSNSVLSGTGISTVTAIGGGYGGQASFQGGSGGSGGGNGFTITSSGGSGTVGQGNDGGSGAGPSSGPRNGGGGGGGAGAVGGNGTSSVGGSGGVGLSNSITGSATFYAGGGGGSINTVTPADYGPGGNGGGGPGGNASTATSGTANTGGGGGGDDGTSGAGGSGVVILRMATANYSTTTTGSPTVTTDGTDTILTFTGSGSYTG
jgi:hypothetical protein